MTISDIAKMAGVSSAAVSRYLNGGPLSEQKREAIREVVEKTGYRPDAAAQTLRTGRVNQIGVIAPSISSQSVGQITAGIASELDQQNYLILLGNTELDEQRELGYLTAMQRNHVAGIILLGCYYSPQLARAFKACRVPLVVTGQRFPEVPCVYNDDRSAARELAQRMLELLCNGSEYDLLTAVEPVSRKREDLLEVCTQLRQLLTAELTRAASGGESRFSTRRITRMLEALDDLLPRVQQNGNTLLLSTLLALRLSQA